ncbi:MAG: hypothetical protein WDN29_07630 [Methylovirgula sp.]
MSLLHFIRRIVLALLACLPLIGAARAREVTDIAGRHVTVPDKVTRVVLGEGGWSMRWRCSIAPTRFSASSAGRTISG